MPDDDDERDDNPEQDEDEDEDDQDEDAEPAPTELDLPIGAPFALSNDCELMQRDDAAGVPGCCACVTCDGCDKPFRINLLADDYASCPTCGAVYTHVLLVCRKEDKSMIAAAGRVVARSNGYGLEGAADDDDDDDADEAEVKR